MTASTDRAPGSVMPGSRIRLRIAGMSCNSCVDHVRSALESIPGVHVIDVRRGSATIELQPEVDSHALVQAVASAGYEVTGADSLDVRSEPAGRTHAAGGAGCCCGPVVTHRLRR